MKQNKETLKQFFETGDKPTQQQYADLIDGYIDAKQPEGEANRRFVIDETGEVSVASEQQVPEYTLSTISGTNTVDLLKAGVSVSQIDLTPYLDNTNLARLVSGTVDVNGLATFTRDDNSTFIVDLSNLKDTVPQYQAGSNITIDATNPLQPIINSLGSSIVTQQGSYSPVFSGVNSTFSATVNSAEYFQIGDRVFVDIYLTNVNSDGNASGGYVKANIPYSAPYKTTTGIVTDLLDYTVYSGAYIPVGYNEIRIKDSVIVNGKLAISFSYTTGGDIY